MSQIITRFAPSPSGLLHLGHAYSAIVAARFAEEHGGRYLLRIEDIDTTRCRAEFEDAIYEDLCWLGLSWEKPAWRQSDRSEVYADALEQLKSVELVYPCFCTRKEIAAAMQEIASAPHGAPEAIYPGKCRTLAESERIARLGSGEPHCWRLDLDRARSQTGNLDWVDALAGTIDATPELLGDVILARKDIATSYHLAVTIDDAAQGVTHVIRGKDLFESTHVHRLLQALLGLPAPVWHHHALIEDAHGNRLAKRDDAASIRSYRERGVPPEEVLALIGLG